MTSLNHPSFLLANFHPHQAQGWNQDLTKIIKPLQRNPEPDTEKHDVELGIVAAFLYNLQQKHEEECKWKVFGLVRWLRGVENNVDDKLGEIWRGLPYQGNDPRKILASMNRQNAR